jgi:NAD(P)-dependent dehydrogenase (short-subunit alcohol dehydrogenase family)
MLKALVIGSSGGIGNAFFEFLRADKRFDYVGSLSRSQDSLDVTDETAVANTADKIRNQGIEFDLIINATGALVIDGTGPEKTIKALTASSMTKQFLVNAIGPALLLKHFHPLLPRNRRCVFASLSARVGSISDNRLGGWVSYRAAKAAQNQIIKTASLEIARTHPYSIVVALHPGTVSTRLSQPFSAGRTTLSPSQSAAMLLTVMEDLSPEQTGGLFAYDGKAIEW